MRPEGKLEFPYKDFTEAIARLDEETDAQARLWFEGKKKVGLAGTVGRTIGRFWEVYFSKGGRKLGVPGLFLAVNAGMREFISFAKYWELKRGRSEDADRLGG